MMGVTDTWDPELLQWRPAGKRLIASVRMSREVGNALSLAETNVVYGLALSSDFTGGLPVAYTTRELAAGVVTRQYWPGVGFTRPAGERFGLLRTSVWGYLNSSVSNDVDVTIEHVDGDRYNSDCYEYIKPAPTRAAQSGQYFACSHETYVHAGWDGERIAAAVTITNVGSSGNINFGALYSTVTWEPLA
jgi:hypothetical protein